MRSKLDRESTTEKKSTTKDKEKQRKRGHSKKPKIHKARRTRDGIRWPERKTSNTQVKRNDEKKRRKSAYVHSTTKEKWHPRDRKENRKRERQLKKKGKRVNENQRAIDNTGGGYGVYATTLNDIGGRRKLESTVRRSCKHPGSEDEGACGHVSDNRKVLRPNPQEKKRSIEEIDGKKKDKERKRTAEGGGQCACLEAAAVKTSSRLLGALRTQSKRSSEKKKERGLVLLLGDTRSYTSTSRRIRKTSIKKNRRTQTHIHKHTGIHRHPRKHRGKRERAHSRRAKQRRRA